LSTKKNSIRIFYKKPRGNSKKQNTGTPVKKPLQRFIIRCRKEEARHEEPEAVVVFPAHVFSRRLRLGSKGTTPSSL